MKIESVPFNELLGIKPAEAPFFLTLDASRRLTNHLGAVHASAQLSLAEATSGHILLSNFGDATDETLAVVRRVKAKFKAPLRGRILSRSLLDTQALDTLSEALSNKGRAFIEIPVEVVDETEALGVSATIEWFAQRRQAEATQR